MDKKLLLCGIAVAIILVIFYTFQPVIAPDFKIKYTEYNGFKNYAESITVSSNGEYEYKMLDYGTDKIRHSFSRKLSKSELGELSKTIFMMGGILSLPEDLSKECFDAATEFIEISYGGKNKKVGGNCVESDSFRVIVHKIYSYRNE